MQLFQNRPFDFLVKPISQNRLRMLMDEYFRIFPQEERYSFDNTDYELLFLTLSDAILVLSLLTESYYRRREKGTDFTSNGTIPSPNGTVRR